jgi:rod shape determining protein RodA
MGLKDFDWFLFIVISLLLSLGLIIQYSLSKTTGDIFFLRQLVFVCLGLSLALLIGLWDWRALGTYAYFFYGLTLLILFLVLFFGQSFRGTRGWFVLPFFDLYFQPVELAKLILIIALAKYWSKRKAYQLKTFFGSLIIFLPFFILVLLQPDFGSGLILTLLWLGVSFLAVERIRHFILILLIIAISAAFFWNFLLADYQKERIFTYLNPGRDPLGQGYQITQAIIAIGSGGIFGRGLGLGPQSQLHFLPEARTDFVFSVLAEELGFFGSILLLILYIFLFYRIFHLAKFASSDFGIFLVLGIGVFFFSQIFINLSVNLGLVPITGIPLPFLSYGGSALIINMIAIGILESIAGHKIALE